MTFPSFCCSGCGLAFPKLRALGAITAEVLPWQNPSQPIFGARRRKGGSGALRCELDMDPRGFQIRLGDAVYSMQYAVYIYNYIIWYTYIYIYLHTMILYMLLIYVDICEELPRFCWGMCCYIDCYDSMDFLVDFSDSLYQKQTCQTDQAIDCHSCSASNLDTTRWISACIGQSQAFRGQDAHLGWQSV